MGVSFSFLFFRKVCIANGWKRILFVQSTGLVSNVENVIAKQANCCPSKGYRKSPKVVSVSLVNLCVFLLQTHDFLAEFRMSPIRFMTRATAIWGIASHTLQLLTKLSTNNTRFFHHKHSNKTLQKLSLKRFNNWPSEQDNLNCKTIET